MTGNGILDKTLLGLSALLGALALVAVIYTQKIYSPEIPNEATEKANFIKINKEAINIETFELEKLTVNLPSQSQRLRFIDLKMNITTSSKDAMAKLEKHQQILKDSAITMAGSMDPDELNTLSGKLLLESRIRREVNRQMGENLLQKIHFTHYVIQ